MGFAESLQENTEMRNQQVINARVEALESTVAEMATRNHWLTSLVGELADYAGFRHGRIVESDDYTDGWDRLRPGKSLDKRVRNLESESPDTLKVMLLMTDKIMELASRVAALELSAEIAEEEAEEAEAKALEEYAEAESSAWDDKVLEALEGAKPLAGAGWAERTVDGEGLEVFFKQRDFTAADLRYAALCLDEELL